MWIKKICNAAMTVVRLAVATGLQSCCRAFDRDPLSHPVLAAMSQRELADLPPEQLRAMRD